MAVYATLLLALPLAVLCEDSTGAITAPATLASMEAGEMPISVLEPLLIGVSTGFISDSPDVMTCGMAVVGEVGDLKTAVVDLKKGIMSFNVTEIKAALQEFQDLVNGSQGAKATCKIVGADIKTLIGAIEKVPRQPKELIIHIVSNFFDDGDHIFGELAASEKAYKTGWDYMTSGQKLGMALRRMLVGEMGGTKPLPPMPKSALEPLAIGMASGFISDSPDVMTCGKSIMGEGTDMKTAVNDLKKGIKGLNITEVEDAIQEIKAAIDESKTSKATCKVIGSDVTAIIHALKQIHGPKDLVIHIVKNFFDDGEPIFGGLAAAERTYKTGKDYMTVGNELGKVFRRMLVGEVNNASTMAASQSAHLIV